MLQQHDDDLRKLDVRDDKGVRHRYDGRGRPILTKYLGLAGVTYDYPDDAEGYEGYKQFKGSLPHQLDFSMDMDAVKGCFPRQPDFSSDVHCAWDFEEYRIIVSFIDGRITDVTLTSDF